jgi:hypothetical protein
MPKENVLPTRNACISTEEGYFPLGIASRARQYRKTEAPRSALEAKCSSPAEVFVTSRGKVIWHRELGAEVRQLEKRRRPNFA